MSKMHVVRTIVNGEVSERVVPSHRTLTDFLRRDLGLTGTKIGCDTGDCGACSVLLDGRLVASCLVLAVEAESFTNPWTRQMYTWELQNRTVCHIYVVRTPAEPVRAKTPSGGSRRPWRSPIARATTRPLRACRCASGCSTPSSSRPSPLAGISRARSPSSAAPSSRGCRGSRGHPIRKGEGVP